MAKSDRDRVLFVDIPGEALVRSLRKMYKIWSTAVLIVTGENTVTIRAYPTMHLLHGTTITQMFDLRSNYISASSKSDGFGLFFNIAMWLSGIGYLIKKKPASVVTLMTTLESTNLTCFIGGQEIKLGTAEFFKPPALHGPGDLALIVRVTMNKKQFRNIINSFLVRYNGVTSRISLVITNASVGLVAPGAYFHLHAQNYDIEGLAPGDTLRLPLRWEEDLLRGLHTKGERYERFELSVFQHFSGAKWNKFRYFCRNGSLSFTHLEELTQPWRA